MSQRASNRKRIPTARPRLECLEDRSCPSSVTVVGHTLTLTGSGVGDQITITDDGQGNISGGVNGQRAVGSGITHLIIRAQRGGDTISYSLSNQLSVSETLDFHLGRGGDSLTLDLSAGVIAPKLNINIFGGSGSDVVSATFGAITGTHLNLRAALGAGDDQFTATLAGNLLGRANAQFDVNGGAGNDSLQVNATEAGIDPAAVLGIQLQGGAGDDALTATYSGQDNGRLRIRADGAGGDDALTGNLTLDPGSTGAVKAIFRGDRGFNTPSLSLTDNSGNGGPSELSSLITLIQGGPAR